MKRSRTVSYVKKGQEVYPQDFVSCSSNFYLGSLSSPPNPPTRKFPLPLAFPKAHITSLEAARSLSLSLRSIFPHQTPSINDTMAPIATQLNGPTNGTTGTTLKATAASFTPKTTPKSSSAPYKYHASSTEDAIQSESTYAAHNYHPLPIVFSRASGVWVWDPENNKYLDFLSAYSAINQGHCHPELVKALTDQASRLTLSSRAFYNDVFPQFARFVTSFFGFDMVLPMNTGAEAVETAIKIARKWGYKVKGIPHNEALVFSVTENFHGRTVCVK